MVSFRGCPCTKGPTVGGPYESPSLLETPNLVKGKDGILKSSQMPKARRVSRSSEGHKTQGSPRVSAD